MATHNGARFLSEQLKSILDQLEQEDELIISDQHSSDETLDIIHQLKDSRIRLLHYKGHQGILGNFENALMQAKGDYIFLSDQDDVWLPEKVSLMRNHLISGAELVVSNCKLINDENQITEPDYFSLHPPSKGLMKSLMRNSYMGCCMAFHKKTLEVALPIPKKIPMHDIWIGHCASILGPVRFEHIPLILYRRHDGAASTTGLISTRSVLTKLKERFLTAYFLLTRCYYSWRQKKL